MKSFKCSIRCRWNLRMCQVLLLVSFLFAGCKEAGGGSSNSLSGPEDETANASSSPARDYPKIKGKWTGVYVVYGGSNAYDGLSVTANIKQDRDAVVIKTNLPANGRMLTGTLDPDGDLTLTDAFDGEQWTSHFGPVSENSIRIADFLKPPTLEDRDPPIAVIELSR